jgi:prepilin-type N-terminal cleavage/methylation domain-containing protein
VPKAQEANGRAVRATGGFTLIELLVVIVIIGILAGLISVAAYTAVLSARRAEIRLEIASLEQAFAALPNGQYPPDFTDEAEVTRYITSRWTNYKGKWQDEPTIPVEVRNPAGAIGFWLGGINGEGFNRNPRTPFTYHSGSMEGPAFQFRPDRLLDADGGTTGTRCYYYQPRATADTQPYVYFKAGTDGYKADGETKKWTDPAREGRVVLACYDTRAGTGKWAKPQSFQLRSPGLDGKHGSESTFPGPFNDDYQNDDIANFSDGTFEDSKQ